ncbi:MAG TPA: tetratricopeptide repeat protein [Polyangia bacterium]|nr:tetratricopeptide repeat protein [Polyangia bacterium]
MKAFLVAPAPALVIALLLLPANPPGGLKAAREHLRAGRYAEALSAARAAGGPAGLTLAGEIERRLARYADARRTLEQVATRWPDAASQRARLFLGLLALDVGEKERATELLDRFYQDYNAGRIDKSSAEQLLYVALAARALEGYQDANRTFQKAAKLDPKNVEIQLEWARTFLERYAVGEAEISVQDALKLDPHDPDAHALLARVRLEQSDAAAALAEVEQALAENPRHPGALALRAEALIEDGLYEEANRDLARALAVAPQSPHLHALRAASAFLADDGKTFEDERKRALAVNPKYAELFVLVASLAVKQHRYPEAIQLEEQALALDPKSWSALAELGTNYLRQGDDGKGLAALKKAWEGDPFNVRTYNILNLFDDVVTKRFSFTDAAPFRLRVIKDDGVVIARQVAPLLRRAYESYRARYGFVPQGPIIVEMYADPQQYAIRTVGLPQLGALGVCFGRVITAMEPGSAHFSWAMVLSHELAHVFAIQMSRSRVPRWFTEGLSEWETAQARPEWRRAGDADLAAALAAGRLRPLGELNLGFTRARSLDEMTAAYYHSYVAVDFLARRFGFAKLTEMLKLWGQGKSTSAVLEQASGRKMADLDAELRAEIEKRVAGYRTQLFVRYDALELPAREKEAKAHPQDALMQARLGLARLAAHDVGGAETAAAACLKIVPEGRDCHVLRGEIAMAKREAKAALAAFDKVVATGADGYDLRMRLAAAALHAGDDDRALVELGRAGKLDPQRSEPLEERAAIYEKKHDGAAALPELEKLCAIDPNAGPAAKKVALAALARSDWPKVARFAARAIEVDPFDAELLEALARADEALGKKKEATEARETARLARQARDGH